jgi:membrane-associated protease RseP (regulator of RpoE activity)
LKDPLDDAPPVETRKAITGGIVIVLGIALLVAARPSAWFTIFLIVGIVFTIMLHEFGHFVMAKRAGMKVTEFFVGFGPRIWSFRKGETEYGIKAIPAGGYVRIIGMSNLEETDPADEPRLYRTASTANKLKTILAGITVNLIIAFVLFYIVIVGAGMDKPTTTIERVQSGSPAAAAGLKAGDKIVAVDGTPIKNWEALGKNVRPNAGKELTVTALRDGEQVEVAVTPAKIGGEGKLGVLSTIERTRYSVFEGVPQSFNVMYRSTSATIGGLAKTFSASGVEKYGKTVANPDAKGSFTGEERPRSVIGIVADGGNLVGNSFWGLLLLLATINIFLALFNLIPLLPFDGGHAAVAVYESVASKIQGRKVQVDYRKLMPVTAVVLVLVLALGMSAMYLDIRQIVTG